MNTLREPPPRLSPAAMIPPFLWLWLALYTVNVPFILLGWWSRFADLTGNGDYSPQVAGTPSFAMLRMLAIVELLPSAVVLSGLLAVAVPHLRTWWVEHRLGLAEDRRPVVTEMQRFVDRHAPAVRIMTNVRRQDRLVRIYPVGWRRARIAVFGPMIVLWRRDRAAAEAALLHEIAHYRTGDHVIVGLGSPFVTFINLWLPLFVLLGIMPTVVFAVVYPIGHLLVAQLALLVTLLPRMLLLPVGGLWLAELSADRYVVELGWGPALRRALDTQPPPRRRVLALVGDLAHPPVALRRWAAGRGDRSFGTVLLLSGFPLLHLGLLLVILSSAVPAEWLLDQPWSQVIAETIVNSHSYLVNAAQLWVPAVLVVLAWPVVSTLWSRWWTGHPQPRSGIPAHSYRAAAALCTILLLGSLVLTS